MTSVAPNVAGVEFGQRTGDCGGRLFVGDVDIRAAGTDHRGGQSQAVEHQMRPVAQQPPVLDRRRFALFAVGDDDGLDAAAAGVAHRAQLDAEREGRAAAPEQSGQVDLLEQRVGIVERLVAACLRVLGVVLGARL